MEFLNSPMSALLAGLKGTPSDDVSQALSTVSQALSTGAKYKKCSQQFFQFFFLCVCKFMVKFVKNSCWKVTRVLPFCVWWSVSVTS